MENKKEMTIPNVSAATDAEQSLSKCTDNIVSRLTDREIRVDGNPRVYKALKNQMEDIYAELQRLTSAQEVTPDMLETLQMIAITLNGMKEDGE